LLAVLVVPQALKLARKAKAKEQQKVDA
jgi:hypothetical protein